MLTGELLYITSKAEEHQEEPSIEHEVTIGALAGTVATQIQWGLLIVVQ